MADNEVLEAPDDIPPGQGSGQHPLVETTPIHDPAEQPDEADDEADVDDGMGDA